MGGKRQEYRDNCLQNARDCGTIDADDDVQWITCNGTHIPITESGELGGAVGKKIERESGNGQETGNSGLAKGSRVGEPANTGAGSVAEQRSGKAELAVLHGEAASGGNENPSDGWQPAGSPNGDVRTRVINPVSEVSAEVHEKSLKETIAKNPDKYATVDLHTAEELRGAKCFVGESENKDGTNRGTYGAIVRDNGDITGVFNGNGRGAAKDAMIKAIGSGGDRLDAYAINQDGSPGQLAITYHRYGFEPIARVPFNPEYAAPGVKPQDIVFYAHNGDNINKVIANYGKYPAPTKAQYDALPIMDYDAAAAYRDNWIENKKRN